VNSALGRQKATRIFNSLKAGLDWCLFARKMSLVLKFMTSLAQLIITRVYCSLSIVFLSISLLRNQLMMDI
jgi:hypothetical protein